ncbi:MAG: hypothetical protein B6I34_04235 [Anaerolineaceae bacterium 4572_32.1]|nr:MAG: hypothetical protein B6I34_04235 [Anaerolineaceae bacterium 4572_32.1]
MTLYNWGIVVILLIFQFLIARFYEKKSGQRSYYALFLIPALLFLIASLRYAFGVGDLAGDVWGDGLLFMGGGILVVLSTLLFRLMMGGKN